MKKMILVPEALVDTLVRKDEASSTPELDAIVRLGKEMEELRERRDISLDRKVRLYKEALRQYLHFRDEFREQSAPSRPVLEPTPPAASSSSPSLPNVSIVDELPKTHRKNAQKILDMVHGVLAYDKDSKEITYDGETVPGSNIVRLIHDTLMSSKSKRAPPVGAEVFSRALSEANVPPHLRRNKQHYPSPIKKRVTEQTGKRRKPKTTDDESESDGWLSMEQ